MRAGMAAWAPIFVDVMQRAQQMSSKRSSVDPSGQSAATVAADRNVSDAMLGATIRGLLGRPDSGEMIIVRSNPIRGSAKEHDVSGQRARSGVVQHVTRASATGGSKFPTDDQHAESVTVVNHAGNPKSAKGYDELVVRNVGGVIEVTTVSDHAKSPGDDLDRALLAAEERGNAAAAALADTEEMLSTAEVAERVEITRQAVAKRRASGKLLVLKAGPKALRYPDWQILPTGQVVEGIQDVLQRFDGDAWAAYRALKEIAPDGTDRPLYELLGEGDLETVLAHIDGILGGAGT